MQGVSDQLPVVILAAGRGRRLAPFTDGTPKCLVPVGSTSALGLLFAWLRGRKPAEVILVTGHACDRIRRFLSEESAPFPVREVFNPKYDSTNNIYSAVLSRDFCPDGFLLLNSDLICHPRILDAAVEGPPSTFLVVDPTLPPRPEAMKVRYAGDRLVAIGKDLD
ncbi:MAG: NTP transferase domain-containing protein, partial [Candidatus Binatia bacterium]